MNSAAIVSLFLYIGYRIRQFFEDIMQVDIFVLISRVVYFFYSSAFTVVVMHDLFVLCVCDTVPCVCIG